MAGIIKNVTARVIFYELEEAFKRCAIMQVFAWMDLIAQIHTELVVEVKQGPPASGEFLEAFFDQTCRALRPRVEVWP